MLEHPRSYRALRDGGEYEVRGLVRDKAKARAVLDCGACEEAEGIYVGDVTASTSSLQTPMAGACTHSDFAFEYQPEGSARLALLGELRNLHLGLAFAPFVSSLVRRSNLRSEYSLSG